MRLVQYSKKTASAIVPAGARAYMVSPWVKKSTGRGPSFTAMAGATEENYALLPAKSVPNFPQRIDLAVGGDEHDSSHV